MTICVKDRGGDPEEFERFMLNILQKQKPNGEDCKVGRFR